MDSQFASTVIRTTYPNLPDIKLPAPLIAACALADEIAATTREPFWPDFDALLKDPSGPATASAVERLAEDFSTDENWSRARTAVSQACAVIVVREAHAAGDNIANQFRERFDAAQRGFREAVAQLNHPAGWGLGHAWRTVTASEILDAGPEFAKAWSEARCHQDTIFTVREWLRTDAAIPAPGQPGEWDEICGLWDVANQFEINIIESAQSAVMWEGIDPQLSVAACQSRLGDRRRNIPLKIRRSAEAKEVRDDITARFRLEAARKRGEV